MRRNVLLTVNCHYDDLTLSYYFKQLYDQIAHLNLSILGFDQLMVQTPKNQNFEDVNMHFKFKPNRSAKIQIAISSKLCIGLA